MFPTNRVKLSQMRFQTEFREIEQLTNFTRKVNHGNFFFCSASTVAQASKNQRLAEIISSGYAILDSTPLAIILTGKRNSVLRGTTFTREFCKTANSAERIILIGGTLELLEKLAARFVMLNKKINIVGIHSPSFQGSIADKVNDAILILNDVKPEFVFVALSSPQQDFFIAQLSKCYEAKYFAVGAAFDFIAGTKPEAPKWLQKTGLEWIFRLGNEPRRLWKRYLVDNFVFMKVSLEYLVLRLASKVKNAQK
jgi:N-acetylglucosaminyldiphosphoundecaprenol N-acetyl-beta-D-mannosaminyltransferase